MPFSQTVRQLQQLIKKYLSGRSTPEESKFLERWYDHFDQRLVEKDADSQAARADAERDLQLLAELNERIDRQEKGRIIPLKSNFRMGLAAAAVIGVLVIGAYWYRTASRDKDRGRTDRRLAAKRPDKAPGTNNAILTLANGQQLVLGATSNGALSRQGNTTILQTDSGSVTYRPTNNSADAVLYNMLTTPRGGQYHLVLSDGTGVWLNSASSLRFPARFTGDSRQVELDGEGYFEVTKDAAHPFRLMIHSMQVDVLGTSFDVMAYSNEQDSKTTLVNGSVRLTGGGTSSILLPGQQGAIRKSAGNKEEDGISVTEADLEETLAWKEGKFRFVNADIQTIMRQIERWYDITVVYQGSLPARRLSGAFSRKQNVSNLFEALEDVSDAQFTISGNTVTVVAAGKK
jgi:ferric-dicitrate binding protein FerR (iron transport regulator)